jgi:hypothetical protein
MCADVLQYAIDHTKEKIGAAVVAVFYPVYRAVCESNWPPYEVVNLFKWYDWDKAKELRKGLVNAFLNSAWNPGDLALAACEDEQLLRKLIKRTLRSDSGGNYVISILQDLEKRQDPRVFRTCDLLRVLLSNPNFHEPWD